MDLTRLTRSERRDKCLNIRVTSSEVSYLQQIAKEHGFKLSGFIREALQAHIESLEA